MNSTNKDDYSIILDELGDDLFLLLDGQNLEAKQEEAMMLLTTGEDGWPHVAMISVGEIVARSRTNLRIGLWPGTTTSENIRRTGKATLVLFYRGRAHYVRLELEPLEIKSLNRKYPIDCYSASVVSHKEDRAKYADIISGVKIQLKDPEQVVARWRETVDDILDY